MVFEFPARPPARHHPAAGGAASGLLYPHVYRLLTRHHGTQSFKPAITHIPACGMQGSLYPHVQLVYPHVQSLYPHVQSVYPHVQSLYPHVQSLYPHVQSVYPHVQSVYPHVQSVYPHVLNPNPTQVHLQRPLSEQEVDMHYFLSNPELQRPLTTIPYYGKLIVQKLYEVEEVAFKSRHWNKSFFLGRRR